MCASLDVHVASNRGILEVGVAGIDKPSVSMMLSFMVSSALSGKPLKMTGIVFVSIKQIGTDMQS